MQQGVAGRIQGHRVEAVDREGQRHLDASKGTKQALIIVAEGIGNALPLVGAVPEPETYALMVAEQVSRPSRVRVNQAAQKVKHELKETGV